MKLSFLVLLMILICLPGIAGAQTKATVPASYVEAADALAFDDYAKAKMALSNLVKEASGELRQRAEAAASAPNIGVMRAQFRVLSQLVSKMELPPGHCLVLCPMFEKGAYWVQKNRIPVNPYMGQAMLSCGDIVKVAPDEKQVPSPGRR
jgi:hypothetical protein